MSEVAGIYISPTHTIDDVSITTEDFAPREGLNLHITRFIPAKPSDLPPIVGSGGVNHPTELYKRFLIKLAEETGRQIDWYDSPGVGASVYTGQSITHEILSKTLEEVISHLHPNEKVSIMGHSLSTMAVRDNNLSKEITEKTIILAPVPAKSEKFLSLNFNYLIASGFSLISRFGIIRPGPHAAANFYANAHSPSAQEWIQSKIADERFPVGPVEFLQALAEVSKKPFPDFNDKNLCVVVGDKDKVINFHQDKLDQNIHSSVHVIKGGDHDAAVVPTDSTNENDLKILDDVIDTVVDCLKN